MTDVILGVGSNRSWMGKNSLTLLSMACMEMEKLYPGITVSSVYRTKPMYVLNQEDFYNMAVRISVCEAVTPHKLLEQIHLIESSLGRDRSKEIRNGPRSIDIDIEFFGNQTVKTSDLEIPHPRIAERAFVLIPLLELLNDSADFINKADYEKLASQSDSQGVEKILSAQDFLKLKED
jgi:2-amino-4-hydroxy-6-hydroxymethyldihydropteridine diphosphokinase